MNTTKSMFVVIETPHDISYIPIHNSNGVELENKEEEIVYIVEGFGIEISGKWEVFDTQEELNEFLEDLKECAN